MSYARARLYLGTSCVGLWVVLSGIFLIFGLPQRLLNTDSGWSVVDVGQLAGVIFVYAFIQGAFDLFGGFLLPQEYGRFTPRLPQFLWHWFRGAALHGLILFGVGLVMLLGARLGGFWYALLGFLLVNLVLIHAQITIARLIGGLTAERRGSVVLLRSPYAHLTGGIAGLIREVVVVPASWRAKFDSATFELLIERRRLLMAQQSRRLGLLAALLWNISGFALAYSASGGTQSVAGLVSFSLWSTLWAFLGVLLLPTPSRRAVFQGDALSLHKGGSVERLQDALKRLDQDQDEEFSRDQAVEALFHPIPSVERRLENPGDAVPRVATWHLARTALYLSWANLSWLSRAVHCNLGRPEVWVFLPSD
jgi:hypothetical protein